MDKWKAGILGNMCSCDGVNEDCDLIVVEAIECHRFPLNIIIIFSNFVLKNSPLELFPHFSPSFCSNAKGSSNE